MYKLHLELLRKKITRGLEAAANEWTSNAAVIEIWRDMDIPAKSN